MNDTFYQLSLNILKALGGDVNIVYPDADAIWDEINKIYDNAGNRFDIVPLEKTITENGEYEYYPDGDVDAFMPVNLTVNIPQKYTDEQVFEIEANAIKQGYDNGYSEGETAGKLIGREEGYTDGYNTGYGTGVTDGGNAQKAKLVDITITENGTYTKDDGYKTVTVEVEAGIPEEELQQMLQDAMDEGYQDGYAEGVDDGREEQKQELESVTFSENGTYTREDGWNSVTVEVAGSGGGGSTGLDLVAMGFTADEQAQWDNENNDRIARAQSLAQRLIDNFPTINPTNIFYNYIKDALDGGNLNGNTDLIVFPSITNRYSGSWNCTGAFKDCVNLVKVGNIGGGSLNDIGYAINMFENCINLEVAPKLRLSGDSNFMFKGCTKLKDLSNLSYSGSYGFQTGNMFENCINLEVAPNIRSSSPSGMFKGCIKLKDVSKFSVYLDKLVSSRHSFAETFMNCTSLETFPNVGSSNQSIGRAVRYNSMFEGCTKLNTTSKFSVDVNTSNSQNYNFNRMFYECKSLTQPVISSITNNKGTAHTASYMYCYCESLQTAASFNFANFKDISCMYSNCKSLTSIPKMDCGKIENCSSFASSCSALTTLGGFTNLGQKANLTGTDWMLRYCSALTKDSVLNVFNNLYDRASAGYSVLTFHINSTPLALLSEDDIAIATNKGWTISS